MKWIAIIAVLLAVCGSLWADEEVKDCKCAHCGCQANCHRVCHVVVEMKDVKETCYSCRCEEFGIPGRSCKIGEVCECDPCKHQWSLFDCLLGRESCETCRAEWQPSSEATIRSRTKLVKREIKRQVPTYKWVVEYCCDACAAAAKEQPGVCKIDANVTQASAIQFGPPPLPAASAASGVGR